VPPRQTSDAKQQRSPLVAAALSFVFPGSGQLYLGRYISAAVFAVPAALTAFWGISQFGHGLAYFAVSLLDDGYSMMIMVVAAAFTALRVLSIAHPFVVERQRRLGLRGGTVLALLLVATVGTGDVVFSNAFAAFSAARQIASNDFVDPTTPPGSPEATPGSTPTLEPSLGVSLLPSDSPGPSPSSSPDSGCGTTTAGRRFTGEQSADAAALPRPLVEAPSPGQSASPSESASPEPSLSVSPGQGASPSESPSPEPSVTPGVTPSPNPRWGPSANPNRLTVLLTGVDFMSGRQHALNDSIMLVSVDLETRAVALVSVPRDTSAFPFYWGGQAPDTFKINGLVKALSAGQFGSPDPPMTTLANEIGWLVGIKVDYYAEIDMDGFSRMIDLVGGVDIYNPTTLDDPYTCTFVPAGEVHLDGPTALQYVRSRETSNDYQRASRQQRVLIGLEKKMATPAMLPKLGALLALAGQSIATNFPLSTARNYVDAAENISSITQCVLGPPYNYHPDSSLTGGTWTSRLLLDQIAGLSVQLFGGDSRYYGQPGVVPSRCRS
jgi:LCP family protein required for cell wall assembly